MKGPLTNWYGADQMPVYIGVYKRRLSVGTKRVTYYSYWDELVWGHNKKTIRDAYYAKESASVYQSLPWRGLAESQP